MKRTSKRYVITTSALNSFKYRVLTSGIDYSQLLNNPILLWMHQRAAGGNKNEILPLGRVVDISLEGDKLTCYLEFDQNDAFAMSIYQKYEAGILNMLSLGAIAIEVSKEPSVMLPGQVGPTVIKCKATEVSCVDIGANDEALPIQLYDLNGKMIALSLGNVAALMRLAKDDKSTDDIVPLKHKANTLAIVKNAIDAGKLNTDTANTLLGLGTDDNSVNTIMQIVKSAKIDPDKLDGKIPSQLLKYVNKSWDEIDNTHAVPFRMNTFKEHAPEVYKAKFFEKNGRLPAERDGKPL